jgi:hypothetical protein
VLNPANTFKAEEEKARTLADGLLRETIEQERRMEIEKLLEDQLRILDNIALELAGYNSKNPLESVNSALLKSIAGILHRRRTSSSGFLKKRPVQLHIVLANNAAQSLKRSSVAMKRL